MLSILPDRSTSPFSTLRRFTCRSVPLTISMPCSVSSRISFKSKERTSRTPVTILVFLLFTTSLCALGICRSSIHFPPSTLLFYRTLHYIYEGLYQNMYARGRSLALSPSVPFTDTGTALLLLLFLSYPAAEAPPPSQSWCQIGSQ